MRALAAFALCAAAASAHAQHHGHQHQHQPEPQEHAAHVDHAGYEQHAGHEQHPREPVPALTDADRAVAFPDLQRPMQHAPELNFMVLFNRFEWQDADAGSAFAWENASWIGSDLNRLWIRSGGERVSGATHSADLELLYGRSIGPWWDVVGGIRHDFNPGPSRTWAAIGVQGLAPYWFEVAATAYLGEGGHAMARVEVEHELLLTNRLVLQPVVELELHGQDDPGRGIGSGLSSVEAGLRLRYEASRRFAPYVGVTTGRLYGDTARMHRQAGGDARETRLVAGVRWWF